MIKVSASYCLVNQNFVIQNIPKNTEPQPSGTVCAILNNTLGRGVPTIPSRYLRSQFNYERIQDKDFKYSYTYNETNWNPVIKGSITQNPAVTFYNDILPQIMPLHMAKSFIPELPVGEIIKNATSFGQVDFYSPLLNLVIEIDGSQHQDGEQYAKDRQRDLLFKQNKITLVRVKTSELPNTELLKQKLNNISNNRENITDYHFIEFSEKEMNLAYSMRIQHILLNLYRTGQIQLTSKTLSLSFLERKNLNQRIINIAIIDFYNWLENIAKLQNIYFERPQINITLCKKESELLNRPDAKIDISVYELYSVPRYDNVIYVRNDYFAPEQKNYFAMDYAQTAYNLDIEKHKNNLHNFLCDISDIYTDFRPNQLEIIIECLNNRCVLGILPVGSGKSLCYQLASLLIPQLTVVIAPLRLLMDDQYNNIVKNLGMTNLTVIQAGKTQNTEIFTENQSIITIVSPERFFSEKFRAAFQSKDLSIGFIVIDEVHCLSEWGHDFRTSYLCLTHNLSLLLPPETYLMALTGTASHRVYEDIKNEFFYFKKKETAVIQAESMKKNNLKVSIENVTNIYQETLATIFPTLEGTKNDKTLIFTKKKNTNKSRTSEDMDSACIPLVERIKASKNIQTGIDYYAGGDSLGKEEQNTFLDKFRKGETKIVFATKAFGMGIDIPDIRRTIHYGLPSSIESLYQQMGRAGRNGDTAYCYIFFKEEYNKELLKKLFRVPCTSIDEIANSLNELDELQTNFFFIQSSNIDVKPELQVLTKILQGIKKQNEQYGKYEATTFSVADSLKKEIRDKHLINLINKPSVAKTIIERALYRLFLLGEIEMWSLTYSDQIDNPTFRNLKTTSYSEENKLSALKSHIERYESKFRFISIQGDDEITLDNTFINRARFLIEWSNNNFLGERIQSMKTLYEQCLNFTDSDTFMELLNKYFMNDPIFVRLVNERSSTDCESWFETLKQPLKNIKLRMARLLESYGEVTSLNFISGITRLMLDEFDDNDGKARLSLAMRDIAEWPKNDRIKLFSKTYQTINNRERENYNSEHINIFIEEWIKHFNTDAEWIYKKTENTSCEQYLFVDMIHNILKLGEAANDKLR